MFLAIGKTGLQQVSLGVNPTHLSSSDSLQLVYLLWKSACLSPSSVGPFVELWGHKDEENRVAEGEDVPI